VLSVEPNARSSLSAVAASVVDAASFAGDDLWSLPRACLLVSDMSTPAHPLLIAGAGIGGLTLAHGLTTAGQRLRIFERDPGPHARDQGYRLHLHGEAVAALRRCLRPEAFDAFWQLSEPLGHGFAFFDHRLRQLAYFSSRSPSDDARLPARVIARSTLRQLLLDLLLAEVEFDRAAKNYAVQDGRVELHFEHGAPVVGSFLVGAEGSHSAIASQLIPEQPSADTGALAVIGKVPTSTEVLRWMPQGRFERLCIVLGPQDVNVFLSQHLPGQADAQTVAGAPQLAGLLDPLPGFSVWAFMIRADELAPGEDPARLTGAMLKARVQRTIEGWHPNLRQLVAAADPDDVSCTRMRSADRLATWNTAPEVTLLGDALHTMTPLQGQGASAAMLDALALFELLKDGPPTRARLARYEAAVVARVRPAVRSSRRTLAWAMTGHAPKAVFKWGLRLADAFTPG
jgi:2-polyprenyl-6-methoxyphenol hydroxylase-like FAD-dependent oxidoreductase